MVLILITLLFPSYQATASQTYMVGSPNPITEALENIYGPNQGGVGTTSCTLCHLTASGGPSNINLEFGGDFQASGGQNQMTVADLETVFRAMASLDSDNDGFTNDDEFQVCTNPNDPGSNGTVNSCTTSSAGGGGGGGCNYIPRQELIASLGTQKHNPSSSFLFFLMAPVFLLVSLRLRVQLI